MGCQEVLQGEIDGLKEQLTAANAENARLRKVAQEAFGLLQNAAIMSERGSFYGENLGRWLNDAAVWVMPGLRSALSQSAPEAQPDAIHQ